MARILLVTTLSTCQSWQFCFLLEGPSRWHASKGSRLGPLSFIVIIDDLATHCGLDKFVDDTTLSELLPPSA